MVVYPLYTSVSVSMDQSIFKPGSDMVVPCEVRGYPPPEVTWEATYELRAASSPRAEE